MRFILEPHTKGQPSRSANHASAASAFAKTFRWSLSPTGLLVFSRQKQSLVFFSLALAPMMIFAIGLVAGNV